MELTEQQLDRIVQVIEDECLDFEMGDPDEDGGSSPVLFVTKPGRQRIRELIEKAEDPSQE